jgi:hypothetical protein
LRAEGEAIHHAGTPWLKWIASALYQVPEMTTQGRCHCEPKAKQSIAPGELADMDCFGVTRLAMTRTMWVSLRETWYKVSVDEDLSTFEPYWKRRAVVVALMREATATAPEIVRRRQPGGSRRARSAPAPANASHQLPTVYFLGFGMPLQLFAFPSVSLAKGVVHLQSAGPRCPWRAKSLGSIMVTPTLIRLLPELGRS